MQSPNFEVYSQAGERETRDTLRYFERVRDFFLQANHHAPSNPVPVYVVIFGSEKEYAPYRFNQFATAYYQSGADRDYIVMGRAGEQTAQVATHEYVHLIARRGGLNLPPWLGEGLAELYSTFQSLGDKVLVGALIPGRMQALNSQKWIPLATILAADQNSPYYNEKDKAGNLYNEGWALVHMLQLTPEYAPKFQAVVNAIATGTSSVAALEAAYGKPISAIDKDLQDYVRGNRFRALQYPVKLDSVKEEYPATPAVLFDVKLALANLGNRPGGDQEAQRKLEELKQDDPKRPEPWAGLAYLAWRHQNVAEAVDDFAQAYALGGRSAKLLWDYGRLAQNGHADDAIKVLNELLVLEPENVEARIDLAGAYMSVRNPAQALAALQPVTKVTPEQAPRLFYTTGFAQMQLGDLEGARASAKRLAEYVKTPQERTQAQQLQAYLDGRSAPVAGSPNLAPPPIQGLSSEAQSPVQLAEVVSVKGSLVELTCSGERYSLVLQTTEGKKRYAIDDLKGILITGRDAGTAKFVCGAQKPVPVTIEYAPDSRPAGISGVVRAIHFEP